MIKRRDFLKAAALTVVAPIAAISGVTAATSAKRIQLELDFTFDRALVNNLDEVFLSINPCKENSASQMLASYLEARGFHVEQRGICTDSADWCGVFATFKDGLQSVKVRRVKLTMPSQVADELLRDPSCVRVRSVKALA